MRANGVFWGAALIAIAIVVASPGPAPAQTLTTLYSFTGGSNGDEPHGGLLQRSCFGHLGRPVSCLYGTTAYGGGDGDVFQLTPYGSTYSESVLHSFNYADGYAPVAGLIADSSGALYSTTYSGGAYGHGTVFKLTPDGFGGYSQSVLYSFTGGSDGDSPAAGLVADSSGALYGTTELGGAYGHGTVFELVPNGSGGYGEGVLHAFAGGSDGATPTAGLIVDASGAFYGTTSQGGGSPSCGSGCGTVFKITRSFLGITYVLHSFNGTDGAYPAAGLIVDASGALYGTTEGGGAVGNGGNGTVFKLTPNGSGGYNESVLHSFAGGNDGAHPKAGLTADTAGDLYGTTESGGAYGYGTVFKLTPGSSGVYYGDVLHAFNHGDGNGPIAGLIADGSGALYGTTAGGGAYGYGTVFKLTGAGFAP